MVDEVTLQPSRAQDSVNRNVDQKFSSRCLYNTVIDVSDVHKAYKLLIQCGNSGLVKVILANRGKWQDICWCS